MANPNVSNRSNGNHYVGALGVGTVLSEPVTFASATGATTSGPFVVTVAATAAAAVATDLASVITLANAMRTRMIALGFHTA